LSRGRFYAADLAFVHDQGFGELASAAAGELISRMRRAGLAGGRVVDLGCGSGVLAAKLGAAGSPVLGVDVSRAMIALARKRAPAARFRVASLLDVEIPACEAIAIVGEGLGYLRDARLGGGVPRLLRRCHAALSPGGLLLLDVRVAPRGRARLLRRQVHREGDGWAVLARTEVGSDRRTLTREITVFRRVGRLYRRSHERHRVRLHRPAELERALRGAGFAARRLRGYGRLVFGPDQAGFAARRG